MKLLEHEAKKIMAQAGVDVPKSFIAGDKPAFLPAVVKSQVPVGGRGKTGGVISVNTVDEYGSAIKRLQDLEIKGFTPKALLAEEVLSIHIEFYLSVVIDKSLAQVQFIANKAGGVEVESNSSSSYLTVAIGIEEKTKHATRFDDAGQQLADYFDLPEKTFELQDLIEKLYRCFIDNDALLIEINPLVLTKGGDLIAADCKMELDDTAAWRHPDWDFETKTVESNFVSLDTNGNVATVANGAGLAMATVDAVADAGLRPANFLDIGGGANEKSILEAFKRINSYPNVKVIIVNIFAGITRCDDVARAIIAAQKRLPDLPKLAVRLAGTNYEQAVEILNKENITIYPNLPDAIVAAKSEIQQ